MTEKNKAPRFDRAVAELNPQVRRKAAVESEARAFSAGASNPPASLRWNDPRGEAWAFQQSSRRIFEKSKRSKRS